MAIGTTAAVIGGASLVGAGASIIGGNKAASAQSSAANTAANAQLEASRIASDTQLQMFNQSRDDAAPWMDSGRNALSVLSNELGLSAFRPTNLGLGADDFNYYQGSQWDNQQALVADIEALRARGVGAGNARYDQAMQRLNLMRAGVDPDAQVAGFTETPGYAFARDQGTQAVDRSAAARGMLRSGATLKAQERFGQGIAAQEYGNYLNRIAGVAGAGQSSTGQINALSASVGGQLGNNALMAGQGAANAALTGGAARASAYQNAGNAINNLAGNALGAAAFGGYLRPGGASAVSSPFIGQGMPLGGGFSR